MLRMIALSIFMNVGFILAQNNVSKSIVEGSATVIGRAVYKDGRPVQNAIIDIFLLNAFEGILPAPAHTDNNGNYTLAYSIYSDGFISVSKPEEGYPDPTISIYDQRHASSLKQISLKQGVALKDVNLQLGDPFLSIVFQTLDAETRTPPRDSRFTIQWSDDPSISISQNISQNGTTLILLPRHPVDVTIAAPGYKDWHWHGDLSREPVRSKTYQLGTIFAPLTPTHP